MRGLYSAILRGLFERNIQFIPTNAACLYKYFTTYAVTPRRR